jgi:hypothetical protein
MPGIGGGTTAALPQSLPKPMYVFEGLEPGLGGNEGEIDVFPAGSVGSVAPTRGGSFRTWSFFDGS